jgi:alcohol dehydrogenase
MKAAVIYEHGGPGSIRYVQDFPDPRPAAGEVVVRVKATALNYHDIFTRRGMPGIKVPMPCIMGIDFAGDIWFLDLLLAGRLADSHVPRWQSAPTLLDTD